MPKGYTKSGSIRRIPIKTANCTRCGIELLTMHRTKTLVCSDCDYIMEKEAIANIRELEYVPRI